MVFGPPVMPVLVQALSSTFSLGAAGAPAS